MRGLKSGSEINGTVFVPGSKSITHRALIAAGLADGESLLKNPLICEDTLLTTKALRRVGIRIAFEREAGESRVNGNGGVFPRVRNREIINLGNSGTSYRFLVSLMALGRGQYVLQGNPRMNRRPIGDLIRALKPLGVEASSMACEDLPPVLIRARGIRGGKTTLPGHLSSQYLSSILLTSAYAEEDVAIEFTGNQVSLPYVGITLSVMAHFGVMVEREAPGVFRVRAGQRYQPRTFTVEGDVSSASYFWAAAAVTGGKVTTKNILTQETGQGDISFLDIMEEMGCHVRREPDRITLRGGELNGIEADMKDMPDMVPTLAATALFAEGKTAIRNVAHLRYKESDRLKAIAMEWRKLGGRVDELTDGLVIHGGTPLSGTVVEPHEDHRLAMSLAVVGLRVPGILLKNDACVSKSFPSFWRLWDSL